MNCIPPAQANFPNNISIIVLNGHWFRVTKFFTLEVARKIYEKLFENQPITIKSRTNVKVYKVKSSKGDKYYKIVNNGNNNWTCNCLGFTYRRRCRHIEECKQQEKGYKEFKRKCKE